MRCPKCGGYSFDSDDRCLNCGYIVSVDTKPPPWWGSKGRTSPGKSKTARTESAESHSPKLSICPRCQERSLFYNDRDGIYECLNRKCRARVKSLSDYEPKQQVPSEKSATVDTIPRHIETPLSSRSKTMAPSKSNNVINIWLRSIVGRLLSWWNWHKPRRVRITKRGLSSFWGLFKKTLVFLSLLGVTTVIILAVSLIISGGIPIASGVIIAALGLVLGIWCSNSLSLHRVSFARFFMIAVISAIFIMASTAYLDIRSFGDVRESVAGALSITKQKQESIPSGPTPGPTIKPKLAPELTNIEDIR